MPVPIPGSKVGSDTQKVKFLTMSRPKTRLFDQISCFLGRAPLATNHAVLPLPEQRPSSLNGAPPWGSSRGSPRDSPGYPPRVSHGKPGFPRDPPKDPQARPPRGSPSDPPAQQPSECPQTWVTTRVEISGQPIDNRAGQNDLQADPWRHRRPFFPGGECSRNRISGTFFCVVGS